MLSLLLPILIGLIGGAAAGLQAPFTGIMGQKTGELTSVFFTYAGGGVVIALILLFSGGGQLSQWRSIPWYAFAAGPLGLIIIGSLAYAVPRVGAAAATTLFVASWLIISAVIDQFGWFGVPTQPLDLKRALGIAGLMVGTWLMISGDF